MAHVVGRNSTESRWPGTIPGQRRSAGLTAGLLRDAAEQAVYAPIGSFRLDVPDELSTLRNAGVETFQVVVDANGLWVRVRGQEVDEIFRWTPATGARKLVALSGFLAWINLVLAALWRDLHVAGEAAVPLRGAVASPDSPSAHAIDQAKQHRQRLASGAVRTLPPVRLSGRRTWATVAERAQIVRSAHGVKGHPRKMAEDWQGQQAAEDRAREYGYHFILPEGHTFVRPHTRGVESVKLVEAAMLPPVVVRSRGLASVIALAEQ